MTPDYGHGRPRQQGWIEREIKEAETMQSNIQNFPVDYVVEQNPGEAPFCTASPSRNVWGPYHNREARESVRRWSWLLLRIWAAVALVGGLAAWAWV